MDWLVFGDDWGRYPTTTQHLIMNLPDTDRVVWVDSIGMRSPKLDLGDIQRIFNKAKGLLAPSTKNLSNSSIYQKQRDNFVRVSPKVLPWHLSNKVRRYNHNSLNRQVSAALSDSEITEPIVLLSNPVAYFYLQDIAVKHLCYLRLDFYEDFPGCDPDLVRACEPALIQNCDSLFGTAHALLDEKLDSKNAHYLPQAVDISHFRKASVEDKNTKKIGFIGSIDDRIDFELVEKTALLLSDWTFEFIGNTNAFAQQALSKMPPNVLALPAISYQEVPSVYNGWQAAWIPYKINHMTKRINPLKIREYLATGIAHHSTNLPEVLAIDKGTFISNEATEIRDWILNVAIKESKSDRLKRRESVELDTWAQRSKEMRELISEKLA